MSDSPQDLAAMIAAAVAQAMAAAQPAPEVDTVTAKVLADAPGGKRAASTEAKAATIKRLLDPVVVDLDSVRFEVTPTYGRDQGGIRRAASVDLYETDDKGKEQRRRGMTLAMLQAFDDDKGLAARLIADIDAVEKRAKIGAHAVKVAAK